MVDGSNPHGAQYDAFKGVDFTDKRHWEAEEDWNAPVEKPSVLRALINRLYTWRD